MSGASKPGLRSAFSTWLRWRRHQTTPKKEAEKVLGPVAPIASEQGIRIASPGKPVRNGFAESFTGRLRDELLNVRELLAVKLPWPDIS